MSYVVSYGSFVCQKLNQIYVNYGNYINYLITLFTNPVLGFGAPRSFLFLENDVPVFWDMSEFVDASMVNGSAAWTFHLKAHIEECVTELDEWYRREEACLFALRGMYRCFGEPNFCLEKRCERIDAHKGK